MGRLDRDERGSGSLLVVAVMIVVLMMAGAAMVIGSYLIAVHRARAAADLVALSGATAVTRGEDGCRSAGEQLRGSGIRLDGCRTVGDQIDFVISVEVRVEVRVRLPGLPSAVVARATAGPVELAADRARTS